jgi:hypothetical protein
MLLDITLSLRAFKDSCQSLLAQQIRSTAHSDVRQGKEAIGTSEIPTESCPKHLISKPDLV